MCPICNGFEQLNVPCPQCQNEMEDRGRFTDFLLDYSPYRPIDEMKLTDGFPHDNRLDQCVHVFYCSVCHTDTHATIDEWAEYQPLTDTGGLT